VVRAFAALMPDILNQHAAPHTLAWLAQLQERAAVRATLAMARRAHPERCFTPGPELARWG